MYQLSDLLEQMPLVPYIRQSSHAVRRPWMLFERRLLDYLFIYIQEGTCRIRADGTDYTFEGGQFCLLQPGCLHTLQGVTNTVTPFVHMDLFYNPRRRESFPTKPAQIDLTPYAHLMQPRLNDIAGLHVPVRVEPRDPYRFRDLFLRMVETWNRHDPLGYIEAQSIATELVTTLIAQYWQQPPSAVHEETALDWLIAYMHLNLAEPITVEQLAERANLSPSRFRAVFKARFGAPPHQYLLRMRLRHARELLRTTGHTLQEIADFCGFADLHHLSKTFRRETGLSPGQYRRQHREQQPRPHKP
jgi:AraC-like DNA-binding protein